MAAAGGGKEEKFEVDEGALLAPPPPKTDFAAVMDGEALLRLPVAEVSRSFIARFSVAAPGLLYK